MLHRLTETPLATSRPMCYAQIMRFDFHSHFPAPDSIVCTAEPKAEAPQACLMRFEGLLPGRWTEEKQARLFSILAENKDIHLGEVGLDKRFTDLVPMQKQADILHSELRFAMENNRCISLHCVRATGLMLEILHGLVLRPFSVIWHGFSGSPETAAQLEKKGVIISIGPRFNGSIAEIKNANGNTVPETDYEGTDAQEYSRILQSQHNRFCSELGLTETELEKHCEAIFKKLSKGCSD